jgi:hypothetical protein
MTWKVTPVNFLKALFVYVYTNLWLEKTTVLDLDGVLF